MSVAKHTAPDHPPVWVLGEALMDCIAQPDGSLVPHLGGSPYNLACATALQSASVGFIAPFSTDAFGQALLDHLQANHARSLLARSALPTSLAVVQVHEGQPTYGFYRENVADRDYQVADVVAMLEASPPGVLHTGSLMAMPPEHHKVLQIIAAAKRLGWVISIDVNLRPHVASDVSAYLQAVREVAAFADWFKASDEDLELLGFADVTLANASALAAHWMAQGCTRVALTFGAQGAYLQVDDANAQGAAPVVDVKDTVGAGDTFWGTCLADWVLHNTLNNAGVAAKRVPQTLQRALVAAAINCSRVGCQPPDVATLDAAL
ncbi:PfkB family carbohydrate kinase [Limnohabitans sp. Jir61]|uniref:PfkB family carbohydrate kinase n=1 Tax=Limnohabitans sp. Jir61 TaxID=1826168 RepID=UPI0011B28BBD|nr:PfkB family carbohydrate kinase [Limnohabitans sp. Jir61]